MPTVKFPFKLDHNGSVQMTSGPIDEEQNRVVMAVGTAIGERVMRPTYGASVMTAYYMAGEDVKQGIALAIKNAFANHLPHLTLHEPVTFHEYSNGSISKVDVLWSSRDTGIPQSTSVPAAGYKQALDV